MDYGRLRNTRPKQWGRAIEMSSSSLPTKSKCSSRRGACSSRFSTLRLPMLLLLEQRRGPGALLKRWRRSS